MLDALIAYGRIDGIRRKHGNPERTMQLIAPCKMQAWAQSYKGRAMRLREEGRPQPAEEAEVDASIKSGMRDFYADVGALIQPEDLNPALDGSPGARTFFMECSPTYRRNVLGWIKLAKTGATRAKRIAATASRTGGRLPQM